MLDPVPFPGDVSYERLRVLLNLQTESASLDYKTLYDLKDPGSKYDFVKDAAAMMSRPQGGYLVVGVDQLGRPVANVQLDVASFDESRLRPLLIRHLSRAGTVLQASHDIGGDPVVVIFLARSDDGLFPVVNADYTYIDRYRKEQKPLRAGDVFVRDGTQTRRWRSEDLEALLAPHVEIARHEERARLGEFQEQLRVQFRGQAAADGPITSLTWRLAAGDFDTAIAELSRRHDRAALRLLTLTMGGDGIEFIRSDSTQHASLLRDLLDRATAALAYAVVLEDNELLDDVVKALRRIYEAGTRPQQDGDPDSAQAAEALIMIASRVLAVLGLVVRLGQWWAVRPLTLQPVGSTYVTASWLRHALTWAYRHQVMPTYDSGKPVNGALIALARAAVDDIAALRVDLPAIARAAPFGQPPDQVDAVLDSLCQADLLWCVVANAEGGRQDTKDFYPSFSALFERRSTPAITLLRDNHLAREALLPGRTTEEVKATVGDVLELANREAIPTGLGHYSLDDDPWR